MTSPLITELIDDLSAETEALMEHLARLSSLDFTTSTPADGWDVRDQVCHLAFFDEQQRKAIVDPDGFAAWAGAELARGAHVVDEAVVSCRRFDGPEALAWFAAARFEMIRAFSHCDPERRLAWFGPPMRPASALTARLMETWAHGQDICDTFSFEQRGTDRLRHIVRLGLAARPYAYLAHERTLPTGAVHLSLISPQGSTWEFGDETDDEITGSALDFCLLVTQRRNLLDCDLEASGPLAREFLQIAQAFAGPPGPGRPPRSKQAP